MVKPLALVALLAGLAALVACASRESPAPQQSPGAQPSPGVQQTTVAASAAAAEPFRRFANQTSFSSGEVWEAYRFAVANPQDALNYIPCYCGCVHHGDSSNRECYIDGVDREGRPIFDSHAAG
ncbi:MAG: hypothetical protein HY686_08235 [Chloroflexi bacterium]|nr:hypothetical protein [Chloroflexota bacterium]